MALLARGFIRDHPLVLVPDEPTAALDAETEHAPFERYAETARGGRITILVLIGSARCVWPT